MNWRNWLLIPALVAVSLTVNLGQKVIADYSATQGSGTTFRAFDSGNGGSALCAAANTQCQAVGLVNSAGAELGTSGNPLQVTVANTGANATAVKVNAASGGIASGAMVDLGAQADSVCGSSTGTCSLIALQKYANTVLAGAIPVGTSRIGYVSDDPCSNASAKVSVPISQTANAKVVTGTSAKKTYICSIMIVAADAENVSLVAGTGSTCGTGTAAVIGGTTAAAGPNLAANGGFALGSGVATIAAGLTNADDFCLFQSASGRVAGVLTYAQQ